MNYLGHVAVAVATGRRDPRFLLGAALPDLASMVGVRVDRALLDGAVGDGVACHLAADRAFHDHPAFRDGSSALRRDLEGVGLATGPRRAVAHAGWELLLDGTLVGSVTEDAYRGALAEGAAALPAMGGVDRDRWRSALHRVGPGALRYDDPAHVARVLVRMLGRRPRLAVPPDREPAVAEVLAAHQRAVAAVAAVVVDDVAAEVAPDR